MKHTPSSKSPARPARALSLVQTEEKTPPSRWFCGYCGAPPEGAGTPPPAARVCLHCGEGVLLEARDDMAPESHQAFLVVDTRLTVQAVSRQAEQMLDVNEPDATDCPVSHLLVGADAEGEHGSFTDLLSRAASTGEGAYSTFVRPRDTFGVRLRARVSYCGPPRAGLIVLETGPGADEPSGRRLRLVEPAAAKSA
jgi:hypothetical protein